MDVPGLAVPLDECAVRLPWIVEHEISPHQSNKIQAAGCLSGQEMGLPPEARDKRGDGVGGFRRRGTEWCPAALEVTGNIADLE